MPTLLSLLLAAPPSLQPPPPRWPCILELHGTLVVDRPAPSALHRDERYHVRIQGILAESPSAVGPVSYVFLSPDQAQAGSLFEFEATRSAEGQDRLRFVEAQPKHPVLQFTLAAAYRGQPLHAEAVLRVGGRWKPEGGELEDISTRTVDPFPIPQQTPQGQPPGPVFTFDGPSPFALRRETTSFQFEGRTRFEGNRDGARVQGQAAVRLTSIK